MMTRVLDATTPRAATDRRLLGRGRSAVVFLHADGPEHVVHKVFTGDALAGLVHLILSGAGNPYAWNPHAIQAAAARRRVLEHLVPFWFGDRLRLPRLDGWAWRDDHRAFELRMAFVRGRGAALHHVFSADRDDELRDLHRTIMRPLQQRLRDAGLDGLVWQAGLGHPVASANFLLEHGNGRPGWVWIDLESGVPALFPLDPFAMLRFYLPQTLRRGRPLFDDVDIPKLRQYLATHRHALIDALGADTVEQLGVHVDALEQHQRRWHEMGRTQRSVEYALRRGHIDESQAAFYRKHGLLWTGRLALWGIARSCRAAARATRRLASMLHPARIAHALGVAFRFVFSQRYRRRLGRHVVIRRVEHWRRRRQLTPAEASYLRAQARSDEAAEYLTDFGIHLAFKPPLKLAEYWVLPMLFAAGAISFTTLVVGVVAGGAICRTAYTLGRLVQAAWLRQELPWVALVVGAMPIIGNTAYPMQIIYTSTEHAHNVAKFILYDLCATFGRKLPIWGGPDTMTEHLFARMPDLLCRRQTRRMPAAVSSPGPA